MVVFFCQCCLLLIRKGQSVKLHWKMHFVQLLPQLRQRNNVRGNVHDTRSRGKCIGGESHHGGAAQDNEGVMHSMQMQWSQVLLDAEYNASIRVVHKILYAAMLLFIRSEWSESDNVEEKKTAFSAVWRWLQCKRCKGCRVEGGVGSMAHWCTDAVNCNKLTPRCDSSTSLCTFAITLSFKTKNHKYNIFVYKYRIICYQWCTTAQCADWAVRKNSIQNRQVYIMLSYIF